VLVVDSDPAVVLYLRRNLLGEGYEVRECPPTVKLVDSLTDHMSDALILGLDDAAEGGSEIIRKIREVSDIPILALWTNTDDHSLAVAIECGADDCIRKPFAMRELLARLHSILRRAIRQRGEIPTFVSGDLEVDLVRRRVRSRQRDVHLPVKAYEVLKVLVERADAVVRYEEIVTAVWGSWRRNRISNVRVAVRQLRRMIEPDPHNPSLIVNELGVGYRLRVLTSTSGIARSL